MSRSNLQRVINMEAPRSCRSIKAIELARMNELRALLYEDELEDEAIGETSSSSSSSRKITFEGRSFKLNRLLVQYSAISCMVDFMAAEVNQEHRREQNIRLASLQLGNSISVPLFKYRRVHVSEWGRWARKQIWTYLLPLIWLYCCLHQVYLIYNQYAYDYYVFRLARVRWLNTTRLIVQNFTVSELEREDFLRNKMEDWGAFLKRIGKQDMRQSFVGEINTIVGVISCLVLYMIPCLYFKWIQPYDFYFLRNLYDYERERKQNKQFVRRQVRKFMHSIQDWSRSLLESCIKSVDGRLVSAGATGQIDCATVQESLLCAQLNEMLARGHLQPLNQRPRWVRAWSKYYNWGLTISYMYMLFLTVTYIKLRGEFQFESYQTFNMAWFVFELTRRVQGYMVHASIIFYGMSLRFTCWDLWVLVNRMRKWLALMIDLNNLRFYGGRRCRRQKRRVSLMKQLDSEGCKLAEPSRADTANRMNCDILLFLIHYRLFLAQFERLKRPLSIFAASSVFVMFLSPLLGRLHAPYFSVPQLTKMRLMVIIINLTLLVPVNTYLVPICYLNKRCADLYRELNSLLAHLMQINLDSRTRPDEFDNHDRHILISILRKELSHHDQAMKQFAISFRGLTFNYNNLITLHVYVGVLIISIFGENLAQIKEQRGTIFTDPFGLF